jgi:hypothetical protein
MYLMYEAEFLIMIAKISQSVKFPSKVYSNNAEIKFYLF